jgi:hypothetical protein
MSNYLVWRDHREVESSVIGVESDGNEDDDQIDEMVANIGREYEVRSGEWTTAGGAEFLQAPYRCRRESPQ